MHSCIHSFIHLLNDIDLIPYFSLAAPTLDISDEVRTIKAGSGTVFEVPYTGHPVPQVTWSHKMSSLDQKRRKSDHIPGKMLKLVIK